MHGPTRARDVPDLVAYADSDWAGDIDDRRSTSRYMTMIGKSLISWSSKKVKSVATSTAAAEFISAYHATCEIVWERGMLAEMFAEQIRPTILFEDNQACIAMVENPIVSERSKHIAIKYFYVREQFENGTITMIYCPTADMAADIMTKAVAVTHFRHLRDDVIGPK